MRRDSTNRFRDSANMFSLARVLVWRHKMHYSATDQPTCVAIATSLVPLTVCTACLSKGGPECWGEFSRPGLGYLFGFGMRGQDRTPLTPQTTVAETYTVPRLGYMGQGDTLV